MNLDELKNRISKLDDILDKTNKEVKIDIAKSRTAQTQLLAKFRMIFVSCLIFALIFTLMVIGGVAPRKFPMELNIGIIVFALIAVILYGYLYFRLRHTDVATVRPTELYRRATCMRLLMMSGEVILCLGLLLLIPLIGSGNDDWPFYISVSLAVYIFFNVKKNWPEYRKLFNELNSIKEIKS